MSSSSSGPPLDSTSSVKDDILSSSGPSPNITSPAKDNSLSQNNLSNTEEGKFDEIASFRRLFSGVNLVPFSTSVSTYIENLDERPFVVRFGTSATNITALDKNRLLSDILKTQTILFPAKNISLDPALTSLESLIQNFHFFFVPIPKTGKTVAHFSITLHTVSSAATFYVQWKFNVALPIMESIDPNATMLSVIKSKMPLQQWQFIKSKYRINFGSRTYPYTESTQSQMILEFGKYFRSLLDEQNICLLTVPFEPIGIRSVESSSFIRSSFFTLYHSLIDTSSVEYMVWNPSVRTDIGKYIPLHNITIQKISVLWYSIFQPLITSQIIELQANKIRAGPPFTFKLIGPNEKFSLKNFTIVDETDLGQYLIFQSILINIPLISFQILNVCLSVEIILPKNTVPLLNFLLQIVKLSFQSCMTAITSSLASVLAIHRILEKILKIDTEDIYQVRTDSYSGFDLIQGVESLASKKFDKLLFYIPSTKRFPKSLQWSDSILFNYRGNYIDPRDNYFRAYLDDRYFRDPKFSSNDFLKQSLFNLIHGIIMYSCTCCDETRKSLDIDMSERKINIDLKKNQPPEFTEIKDTPSLVQYCKLILTYFGNDVLPDTFAEIFDAPMLKALETTISITVTSFIRFFVSNVMQTSGDLPSVDVIYSAMCSLDPVNMFKMIAVVAVVITSILITFPKVIFKLEKITAFFSTQLSLGTFYLGYFHFYYFVLTECTDISPESQEIIRLKRTYDYYYLPSGIWQSVKDNIGFKQFYDETSTHFNSILFFEFALAFKSLNLLYPRSIEEALANLNRANFDFFQPYGLQLLPLNSEE